MHTSQFTTSNTYTLTYMGIKRLSNSLGEETATPRSEYPTKRFISGGEVAACESERAAMQAGELWLIYPIKALGTS